MNSSWIATCIVSTHVTISNVHTIPARVTVITIYRYMYNMSERFLKYKDWFRDYAYITYPGNSNTEFGFQGFFDQIALANTDLHACGCPNPKHQDTCLARCPIPVARQYCDEGRLIKIFSDLLQKHFTTCLVTRVSSRWITNSKVHPLCVCMCNWPECFT